MKILHINSYYSYSRFYKNLYKNQVKEDIDIDVYVPVNKNFDEKSFDWGAYTQICKVYDSLDRYIFQVKHNKIYKHLIDKNNVDEYDILHAHSLFSNGYIALKMKKKYNIPYIVAVRNTDVNIFFKYMIHLRSIGIEILKEAKKVVFLSESYKELVISKYIPNKLKFRIQEKSCVIPNGIDEFWLKNINKKDKISYKDTLKIIYAGVVNKNKNIQTTIKAIEILRRKGYRVNFTVVGKIEDEKIYKRFKAIPYIKYIKPVSKEELINLYRENDIFVMPSIYETFGLVYAEAMSQGLPVIYSRGQGFDKQFEEGEIGYSVNSTNEKEIAKKIVKIIDNYEKITLNCSSFVNKYNWEKISDQYYKLYTE